MTSRSSSVHTSTKNNSPPHSSDRHKSYGAAETLKML